MSTNYFRVVEKVKCNSCGNIANDIDVEKTIFKEIDVNTFECIITMDCECGGTYYYDNLNKMYNWNLPHTNNILNNIKYYDAGSVLICEEAYNKLVTEGHFEGYDEILIEMNSENLFKASIKGKPIIDDNLLLGNFVKLYSVIL